MLPGLVEAARGWSACNRADKTPEVSWGGNKVLRKLPGVGVQVTWLVTTPGGSLSCDQVFLKLSGIEVQVTGLVRTPEGIWVGD